LTPLIFRPVGAQTSDDGYRFIIAGIEAGMIYLLETERYTWVRSPGIPREVVQKYVSGAALQQADIPIETIANGRVELPDICHANDGCFIVSGYFRAALEEFVPGLITFFRLHLVGSEKMLAGREFFLFDVLPRAQMIDWDRSPTALRVTRAPEGRESRALSAPITDPSVRFKAVNPETPPIWRESDTNTPTVHFFRSKRDVFLRDELWSELNARFPKQLVARKLG
jgi:hypothetical protein